MVRHGWKQVALLLTVVVSLGGFAVSSNQYVVRRAAVLARKGKLKEAETLLRVAVAKDGDSAELHGALGKLLFTERNYTAAVQELNLAEQLDPDSREYNMMLAASLLGAKRYAVAQNFLLAIQSRFAQYPEFHYSLALAYYNLAEIVKSKQEVEEALRINPMLEQAQFLLATCYASEGNLSKAADILKQLVKLYPRSVIDWTMLADFLHQMGGEYRTEALRACQRALTIEPKNLHAQFVMAMILLGKDDFVGARIFLERLEQVAPNELPAHVELARIYARLGKTDLARKETEIANKIRQSQSFEADSPQSGVGISRQR